ncbi:MAG: ATP-binding cassette domain-containing protein, partial [Spirochaetota bacterium]
MKSSSQDTLLSVNGASASYRGKNILHDISLNIFRGEHLLIRGANGSGKTTLLKLLSGELNPDDGISPSRIWTFDGESSSSPIFARRHTALVTPQTQDLYRRMGWNISTWECVATGLRGTPLLYDDLSPEEAAHVEDTISFAGIEKLRDKSMLEMSRGESRKVLIARGIA